MPYYYFQKKAVDDRYRKSILAQIIIVLALVVKESFDLDFAAAMLGAFFVIGWLFGFPSRVYAISALAVFTGCVLMMIFGKEEIAGNLAAYTYYLMAFMVFSNMMEAAGRTAFRRLAWLRNLRYLWITLAERLLTRISKSVKIRKEE